MFHCISLAFHLKYTFLGSETIYVLKYGSIQSDNKAYGKSRSAAMGLIRLNKIYLEFFFITTTIFKSHTGAVNIYF